jgi:hypothetical protein
MAWCSCVKGDQDIDTPPDRCSAESESLGQCTLSAGHDGIHWTTNPPPSDRKDWQQAFVEHETTIRQLEGENERLRGILRQVERTAGAVCSTYETCAHPACQASYSAWALTHGALTLASDDFRLPEEGTDA